MKTADKAAFTLVELMVVIGLMALLGTISVTGYSAAVRGMSDRAALDDTRSLIRLAMQTCLIDQTPTAVLFYNHQNQVEDGDKVSREEVQATSSGSAIAIKMAGRVSYVGRLDISSEGLVDEFADWNQSYPVKDKNSGAGQKSKGGVRFYRMTDLNALESGIESCSSVMNDYVEPVHGIFDAEYMIAAGCRVERFCSDFMKSATDNKNFRETTCLNGNNYRWGRGFKDKGRPSWKIGDAYGVEIASLDLPKGYIFGRQEPSSMEITQVRSLQMSPGDVSDWNKFVSTKLEAVPISAFRGDGFKEIGKVSHTDLEDEK